jgi:hypothetical protein
MKRSAAKSKGAFDQRNSKRGKLSSAVEETTNSTMEGAEKAKVLKTLSPEEQERFAAYRRSAFPADKVSKFIASSLVKYSKHIEKSRNIGDAMAGKDRVRTRVSLEQYDVNNPPPLKDLVAPNSSVDIVITVSSLAKQFAQRLVEHAVKNNQGREPGPIQTEHILKAAFDGRMDELFMDTCVFKSSAKSHEIDPLSMNATFVSEEIKEGK